MAAIQSKKMNWVRKPSAYESMNSWREKRRAAQDEFETKMSAVTWAFSSAFSNKIAGLGELAANQALARVAAETQAKIEATVKSIDLTA